MRSMAQRLRRFAVSVAILTGALFSSALFPSLVFGQAAPPWRIVQRVDESQRTRLRGNTHPLTRTEADAGEAPADLPMRRMLLILKRSPEQEASLKTLLDQQQDKHSPNYHRWLTPEEFGQQFGAADQDIATIEDWLTSHGLQVGRATKGRIAIEFSGTAAQVQQAFHTEIHKYTSRGAQHWANANDPEIPTALAPAIAGVDSLNNFGKKPRYSLAGAFQRNKKTGRVQPAPSPNVASADAADSYGAEFTYAGCRQYCYGVTPYDFAAIYNLLPLWNANPPIDGTEVSVAIVGRSNINIQDVRDFRNLFGLPANDPQILLEAGQDPGLVSGDETESALDVEWAGAVAPRATIKFVVAESTEATDGIDLSALYAIDNNLAPILTVSYGQCELFMGTAGNQFYSDLWEEAAAQGITVVTGSGDNGSADCNDDPGYGDDASVGLAVDGVTSTPFAISVGGTDLMNYGPNYNVFESPYWNLSNAANLQSATGYIPEMVWNQGCANPAATTLASANQVDACASGQFNNLHAGGGGASNCVASDGENAPSCTGGYAKPSWQSGPGVPADGARDVPDVSLFSGGIFGSKTLICESDRNPGNASCDSGAPNAELLGLVGTSVSAQTFGGLMALVEQYNNTDHTIGMGNVDYELYKLDTLGGMSCDATGAQGGACTFNDITIGTNAVICAAGDTDCVQSAPNAQPFLGGFSAGAGYDLASGLGSVNAYDLVHNWGLANFAASQTTLSLNGSTSGGSPASVQHGQSVPVTVTVGGNGSAAPSGDVSLLAEYADGPPQPVGRLTLNSTVNGGSASGTALLPGGTYNVVAHYVGDATYGGSDSKPVAVSVAREPSESHLAMVTFDASGTTVTGENASSFPYGSYYILSGSVTDAAGTACTANPAGVPDCPSGNVLVSNNGSPVDGGVFGLNALGYFEDWAISLAAGTYTLDAAYAGDNSFLPSNGSQTVTVTPAPTTSTAGTSGPLMSGSSATLTAVINTTSVGAGPTGTVTFFSGNRQLAGPVQVSGIAGNPSGAFASATAAAVTTLLPAGSSNVTVQYSGDANYAPSSGTTSITVTGPDFSASVAPASQTVAAGQTATYTLSLTPINVVNGGVNETVSITCSGAPLDSMCTPANSNITVSGTSPAQVEIAVTTMPRTSALRWWNVRPPEPGVPVAVALTLCITLGLTWWGLRRPSRRRAGAGALLFALLLAMVCAGCGTTSAVNTGTISTGTPVGTYTLTVTAGSHSTTFSLTVN